MNPCVNIVNMYIPLRRMTSNYIFIDFYYIKWHKVKPKKVKAVQSNTKKNESDENIIYFSPCEYHFILVGNRDSIESINSNECYSPCRQNAGKIFDKDTKTTRPLGYINDNDVKLQAHKHFHPQHCKGYYIRNSQCPE